MTLSIYFAGSLFNHKDLAGNALLAAAIDRIGNGRFRCVLPQNFEAAAGRAVDIRNEDLRQLIGCDLALFHFDGPELDSGTVVEFMIAKFLDIPAVIIRTDFRHAGDQEGDGDPWNLMCSFYPRTRVVRLNAMEEYHGVRSQAWQLPEVLQHWFERMAVAVVDNFDLVLRDPPLLPEDARQTQWLYGWVLRMAGGGLNRLLSHVEVKELIAAKIGKGVIKGTEG